MWVTVFPISLVASFVGGTQRGSRPIGQLHRPQSRALGQARYSAMNIRLSIIQEQEPHGTQWPVRGGSSKNLVFAVYSGRAPIYTERDSVRS